MEPNELENEIREKLGKREILPSAHAWDRLDAMLSVQESIPEKKSFPWMQIVAGVILFLGIGYFVFNSEINTSEKINSNAITKISADTLKENVSKEEIAATNSSVQTKNQQETIVQKGADDEERINETKTIHQVSKSIESVIEKETQIAQNDVNKEVKNEQKNIEVSNQALAEIKAPVEKPKLKVDPNALLNQVDGEIQLTFRQKVMKTITKGYREAKEAVVSRNQESSINH
ncbi:hypothetical protein [Flavobacterium sp. H122]|uniref:hypothetical protein n=1 Tax=Flavobacterium sp. H122 TaxID=2529860 RepID=UPI0010AA91C8|nr:hypothetical protein [Flavobacterium sp. H122]